MVNKSVNHVRLIALKFDQSIGTEYIDPCWDESDCLFGSGLLGLVGLARRKKA